MAKSNGMSATIGVVGAADIYGGGASSKLDMGSPATWTYIWMIVAAFVLFISSFSIVHHLEG